jgi:transcriptional regulator with XRE-family HTH domain
MQLKAITRQLESRRERLGMSCSVVAKRSGVSLRSVQRVLSQTDTNPDYDTVAAIAEALGAKLHVDLVTGRPPEYLRRRQARSKARKLVAITQGTAALEAQGVPATVLGKLQQQTARELLRGSNHRLWS